MSNDYKFNTEWNKIPSFFDVYGNRFYRMIEFCVNYFNKHGTDLPFIIQYSDMPKSMGHEFDIVQSISSKVVNNLVKIGFLKPYMAGIYDESIVFLESKDLEQRKMALSKAVFRNGNFANLMEKRAPKWDGHVAYLIRTLEKAQILSVNDLVTLMYYDYPSHNNSYLTKDHLFKISENIVDQFIGRKYHTAQKLCSFLSKLKNIKFENDLLMYDSGILYDDMFK